jgi:hypothetical protein
VKTTPASPADVWKAGPRGIRKQWNGRAVGMVACCAMLPPSKVMRPRVVGC